MKRLILRNNECYEVDLECMKKKEKGQKCETREHKTIQQKRRRK